jgi:hypothetical protein
MLVDAMKMEWLKIKGRNESLLFKTVLVGDDWSPRREAMMDISVSFMLPFEPIVALVDSLIGLVFL